MKVAFVIDYFDGPVAGTQTQLMVLIRGLLKKGLRPQLLVFRPTVFSSEASDFLCPISCLNIYHILSFRALITMFRFSRSLKREGVDVVQIFFNDASILAPIFAWMAGSKVIVSRRDMGFWYTRSILASLRGANLFVDRITANSIAVADNVAKNEWVRRKKIRIIYNGYAMGRMDQLPEINFRQEHGIGQGDPIVGIVANFTPVKRHEDLLMAFSEVHRSMPSAHLVLVGIGELQERLSILAGRLGLERYIHFLSGVTEVIPIVKHFDVGVLCSESEGLSNALIEYMACGVPPVCTAVGGNIELVTDHVNGLLVSFGDVKALATSITSLLEDRELATRIGQCARKSVERLSEESMVNEHLKMYEELCSGVSEEKISR